MHTNNRLLRDFSTSTACVTEAIKIWRESLGNPRQAFIWCGIDYLSKISTDAQNILAKSEGFAVFTPSLLLGTHVLDLTKGGGKEEQAVTLSVEAGAGEGVLEGRYVCMRDYGWYVCMRDYVSADFVTLQGKACRLG